MPTYKGYIIDSGNAEPLAGSTVTLKDGTKTIAQQSAANDGSFSITTAKPVTHTAISHIDYITMIFPASEYQNKFELERDYENAGEVIVYSNSKKKPPIWLLLLGAILILSRKK